MPPNKSLPNRLKLYSIRPTGHRLSCRQSKSSEKADLFPSIQCKIYLFFVRFSLFSKDCLLKENPTALLGILIYHLTIKLKKNFFCGQIHLNLKMVILICLKFQNLKSQLMAFALMPMALCRSMLPDRLIIDFDELILTASFG